MSAKFKNGITIDDGNIDTASGQVYKINGTTVLSSTQVLGKGFSTTAGDITTIDATQTLTNKTLTSPTIDGGTHTALTNFALRDTSAAFDVTITATSSTTLTAARTLTLDLVNAAKTIKLGGNITTAANFITSGANSLTLTTTGTTNVTLPSGTNTLSTLGANTYTGTQTMPSLSLSAQAADLNINSNKVTSVTDPTSAQDAATKNYVDTNQRDYVKTTSSVSTGPATLNRLDIRDTFTPSSATSNNVFSGRTVSPVTATKTWNCRFSASALGSGVSIKVGVWSTSVDGSFNTTLIGSTGIITPSSITALTTGAFSSSFTLTAGTSYFVGMGVTWSTTAPTIRGFGSTTANTAALPSHILVLTPVMAASGSWAASGNALPVVNVLNNQQFIPWIELY
jgi:hypothetical protein